MKNKIPLVSLIIPCRNEEKYIRKCLESMLNQTYPQDRLEILVVDGISEDGTREIIKEYSDQVKLLNNQKKIFSSANNVGIKKARGDIIMILGSHAIYPKDYVEKCVEYLKKYNADNVGASLDAISLKSTIIARAIVLSLGGRFGKGREKIEKTQWTDTVFGGCYKKEVFKKIGFFNENLKGSSDIDFNLRLLKSGGRTLLISGLVVYYYPKDNLKDFFFHNIKDGIWAILPIKFTKRPLRLRHYIPLVFILTLPLGIWLYIPAALYFSAKIAIQEGDLRLFFVMPIVFMIRHIGYGLGSLWGLIRLIV